MSTPLAANETRRQLRYNYTPDERITKAVELAEALNRIDATTAELDRIKADYKARLAAIESSAELLRGCVTTGYEMREYLCFWTYDEPRSGRKTLRKREGMEIVAEEDMTERDRQMVMEILDQQAAAGAQGETTPGEKLALPAPKEWPTESVEVAFSPVQAAAGAEGKLDGEWCVTFADWFFNIFCDEDNALRTQDDAEHTLAGMLDEAGEEAVELFLLWLTKTPVVLAAPGSHYVTVKTQRVMRDRLAAAEAEKAQAAEQKKKARKGRKATGSGTVDVPSDEGSRDDAGADSKDKL